MSGGGDDRELLDRFLSNRAEQTRRAYTIDLDDFARYRGRALPEAVADLLRAGPGSGRQIALDYEGDLRRRGRAPATITRRLSTLRALVEMARAGGQVDWSLQRPERHRFSLVAAEPAGSDATYMLPRHHTEIDRLDIQHYALRAALRGNHLAPLGQPARILDVGSGTGQWAYDLCAEFPEALVVGLDLHPSKPGRPGNFSFVKGNLLQGLPFAGGRFDFVHQRLMMTAVPLNAWRAVVNDLVRVTRPGGFVELVEVGDQMEPVGPAMRQLWELGNRLAASFGLDSTGIVLRSLEDYLRQAGAAAVEVQRVALPVGEWGHRIGSLMASDVRALFARLCSAFEARFGLLPGECEELLTTAMQECERNHTRAIFTVAYGQVPPM
jgi:SAM-dependent methyltransferase